MPEPSNWLKLYEILAPQEQRLADAYHERVAFYSGLLVAVIGGVAAGMFFATRSIHFSLTALGSVLVVVLSRTAIRATARAYKSWLLYVTIRAKLEQEVGLAEPRQAVADRYWSSEPILPTYFLEARTPFAESRAFVEHNESRGQHAFVRNLFAICAVIGVVGIVASAALLAVPIVREVCRLTSGCS